MIFPNSFHPRLIRTLFFLFPILAILLGAVVVNGAMLYKNYVVRYDRGWDILCDPYRVEAGDWVLKIFRQKGEIAHEDFREFLGIFERLNPHVKDIDRIRPGQVVDIPIKKLAPGNLPGQDTGIVSIPFVMISSTKETIEKHSTEYTVQKGDTVSTLISKRFGGKYGDNLYNQGVKLFLAANPHIKDINRIYAGQKVHMPDPSIREKNWYESLFDEDGNIVDEKAPSESQGEETTASRPAPAAPPARQWTETDSEPRNPLEASAMKTAAAIGGRLIRKGTLFLPTRQGEDFELDLSQYPMIDMENGSKIILTSKDRIMDVDLSEIGSFREDVQFVKVPEDGSYTEVMEAVLSSASGKGTPDRLAFEEQGVSIQVSAKWISSKPASDGSSIRHTCITPIGSVAQQTHGAIVRYLDQNDILIKDILTGGEQPTQPEYAAPQRIQVDRIDGSDQKTFVASFSRIMGFTYSPNISISFPYAGIQVQALSNLLSFGSGNEILIDFGDLYGDAIKAIRQTGLQILQIDADAGPVDIIKQLMGFVGMEYTLNPYWYGAKRPSEYNTTISVAGILVKTQTGQQRLFTTLDIPEPIRVFLTDQGIRQARIQGNATLNVNDKKQVAETDI